MAREAIREEVPHNADAESIVLGCMMLAPAALEQVTDRLTSSAFYSPVHSMLYAQIIAAWAAGEPTEPVALAERLARMGELGRVQGGAAYLHTLIRSVPTTANAVYYADLVADAAGRRALLETSARLGQIGREVADPERRAQLVADVRERLDDAGLRRASRSAPLDWPTFLQREQGPVDFLAGRLMVRGQQIALVGEGKAGKSLFALEWAWRIAAGLPFLQDGARAPLRVMYVDQENPEDDIQERLMSLGAIAETLRNLVYLSFPAFRPLNTAAGAADLLAAVDEHRPAVVYLDTISRMVQGKENDPDPWLDMYRLALMPLKARKVSSIRLDHFGKDASRGSRGSSAKTQDVDAVWELIPTERGSDLLDLKRTHTRNGKGTDDLLIRRHGEQIGDRWKAGGTWHGVADESERPETTPDPNSQYRPAWLRVLGVLGAADAPLTVSQIGDALAAQTKGPLQKRTIQDALKGLGEAGEVDELGAHPGKSSMWEARRS